MRMQAEIKRFTRDKRCVRGLVLAGMAALAMALSFLAGCATTPSERRPPGDGQTGTASYYAHKFHGRVTASGERYDETALTAAHPTLPFGTRVRVVNLENGRAVTVRINDRGPFVKGRIIDISYAAARKLKMVNQGLVRVRVVPLGR